ncbi:MAG: serine/threonine protein kinase [Verrucomicrobia bacterium]|nr:serine/threonine protein kinase [Verrucomicrobiota bacterium]
MDWISPKPTLCGSCPKILPIPHSALGSVRRFGDYELFEQIARGGMGVVYKARQVKLNRTVALKMILSGQFASKQEVLRFRSEAEAAANLRHPNIVAIYETGECEAQHYFSMEYVQGRNLAEIVRDGPLPAQRAARYAQIIAEAIHYAHQQGTLHRDLKPSNVLIDADDQPRITDFGLAKRVRGDFGLTVTGQVLGSPNFMPPEQTGARHAKVGPPSDVYGIGAILYHLLTGRPPFQAEAIEDVLLQLREKEPVAPRLLNPSVPRDLETICLKCLEKEPGKRYPTAHALAEELGRFLRDEPILARPATRFERGWRWCRRKPVIASLAAATAALVLVVAIGSPIAAFRISRSAQLLRQNLYVADMNVAQQALEENDLGRVFDLLQKHIPKPSEEDLRGFEWCYLWKRCEGDQISTIHAHDVGVSCLAYSPDGTRLASGGLYEDMTVKIWDVATKKLLTTLPMFDQGLYRNSLAFSPDGRFLALAMGKGKVGLWNLQAQSKIGDFNGQMENLAFMTFSTQGDLLAAGTRNGRVRLVDVQTRREIDTFQAHTLSVSAMAFSPDGRKLVTGSMDQLIQVRDIAARTNLATYKGHRNEIWQIAFAPDGRAFASASKDGTVRFWKAEPETEESVGPYLGSPLGFSADSLHLITESTNRTIHIWDMVSRRETGSLQLSNAAQPLPMAMTSTISHRTISDDKKLLTVGLTNGFVQLWNLQTGQLIETLPGDLTPRKTFAFSRDGRFLAVGGWKLAESKATGAVRVRDLKTRHTKVFSIDASLSAGYAPLALSPDGTLFATGWTQNRTKLWDVRTQQELITLAGPRGDLLSLAFSPDGKLLAGASRDNTAWLWEVPSGKEHAILKAHKEAVAHVAFSPDGKTLITGGSDGLVQLWNVASTRAVLTLRSPDASAIFAVFSPDGNSLVFTSEARSREQRFPLVLQTQPLAEIDAEIAKRTVR